MPQKDGSDLPANGLLAVSISAARRRSLPSPREEKAYTQAKIELNVIGSVVMERFRVDERLEEGGFGAVYRAWDSRLERHVAVKAIEVGGETGKRILREAHAAARLNHPGVVTLYELGREGSVWLMVTELVEGGTLRERCAAGELSDHDIAEIGADLCDALSHAHTHGIIHRAIKPHNVLVSDTAATAKLGDFGIGRLLVHARVPADGPRPPELAYLSPEQAAGALGGPEADVYSLGLTLHECLSGRAPGDAGSLPLRRARTDLPRSLTQAIDACLHPQPGRRPSLDYLASAIEASIPDLSTEPRIVKGSDPLTKAPASLAASIAAAEPPAIAFAAVLAGLIGAAAAGIGLPGSAPLLLMAPLLAILSFARPERALLIALGGVCVWLAIAAGQPGSAVVLAVAGFGAAQLMRDSGRGMILPGAAPLLGAAGLAFAMPFLAALAETARRRASLCLAGLLCAALAETALARDLLPLVSASAPDPGWQESFFAGIGQVLVPAFAQPALWGMALLFATVSVWIGDRLTGLRARGDATPEAAERPEPRPAALRSLPAGGGRGGLLP